MRRGNPKKTARKDWSGNMDFSLLDERGLIDVPLVKASASPEKIVATFVDVWYKSIPHEMYTIPREIRYAQDYLDGKLFLDRPRGENEFIDGLAEYLNDQTINMGVSFGIEGGSYGFWIDFYEGHDQGDVGRAKRNPEDDYSDIAYARDIVKSLSLELEETTRTLWLKQDADGYRYADLLDNLRDVYQGIQRYHNLSVIDWHKIKPIKISDLDKAVGILKKYAKKIYKQLTSDATMWALQEFDSSNWFGEKFHRQEAKRDAGVLEGFAIRLEMVKKGLESMDSQIKKSQRQGKVKVIKKSNF